MPTICVLILVRPSGSSRKASSLGASSLRNLEKAAQVHRFSKGRCDGDGLWDSGGLIAPNLGSSLGVIH